MERVLGNLLQRCLQPIDGYQTSHNDKRHDLIAMFRRLKGLHAEGDFGSAVRRFQCLICCTCPVSKE